MDNFANNVFQGAENGAVYGAVGTGINTVMHGYNGGLGGNMVRGAEYGAMNSGLNQVENHVLGQPHGIVDGGIRNGINWGVEQKVMGGNGNFVDNMERGVALGAMQHVLPHPHGHGVVGQVENQVMWNLENKAFNAAKNAFHHH
ncbi:fignl1 [Acrasis kona]|uniref:Fignl1 n=1 Tax=Acrasis kona TaxID=1008807 RepID=A0AAW2Z4W5_9EUKA